MSTVEEQKAAVRLAIDRFRHSKRATVSVQQAASTRDRPVPKGICNSKVKVPPPSSRETDARALYLEAVSNLSTGDEAFTLPKYADWEGEWIGHTAQDSIDGLSEKEKYNLLTKDRNSDVTVMYVHGGAYTYGGPVTARSITIPLSTLTGGRCFAVKYRLAPQAQTLSLQFDVFIAYLSLLYPPTGAFHTPVPSESLVLAGDSCGAVMVFFLVQVILQLRRQQDTINPTLRWYGQSVEVPLPAGVTGLSFAGDHLLCLPSYHNPINIENDMMNDLPPYRSPTGQVDAIWPADPPRGDISCELSAMTSVVNNPCIADSWRGAPPMYLACGEERLADGSKLLAQQAAADGVPVRFEEYAIMPHCFVSMVPKLPQAKRCLAAWAKFITDSCSGKTSSSAVRVEAGPLRESHLDVSKLVGFTLDGARAMMKAKRCTLRVWEGPTEQTAKL